MAQLKTTQKIKARLEYLRGELRGERISQGELCELADLAPHISPGDVELLEPAGVPERRRKLIWYDPDHAKVWMIGEDGQLCSCDPLPTGGPVLIDLDDMEPVYTTREFTEADFLSIWWRVTGETVV